MSSETPLMDALLEAKQQMDADRRDGEALRRLVEALPAGSPGPYRVLVRGPWPVPQGPTWTVEVEPYNGDSLLDRYGPIIAAAADACREAIEARS